MNASKLSKLSAYQTGYSIKAAVGAHHRDHKHTILVLGDTN